MFLHNLSDGEKVSFGGWTKSFFGIEIVTQTSRGHVSLFLKGDDTNGTSYNLADTGFGYSQMLPILVQLWSIGHRKRATTPNPGPSIFAIEQPELHLHPKLQAKLADIFIRAIGAAKSIGVDLRLIIETHSEQLISAIGLRIAQEADVAAADVNIVLFEKDKLDSPTTVTQVTFNSNGTLSSWPYGFFDASL
jgi:predicted ATPase